MSVYIHNNTLESLNFPRLKFHFAFFFPSLFFLSSSFSHSKTLGFGRRLQCNRIPVVHHNMHPVPYSAGGRRGDVTTYAPPFFSALHLGHEFRACQKQPLPPTSVNFTPISLEISFPFNACETHCKPYLLASYCVHVLPGLPMAQFALHFIVLPQFYNSRRLFKSGIPFVFQNSSDYICYIAR